MKTDRLLGIIMILLQQEKVTAPQLAARFEVSRRTINRDIEDICKAGIPLITSQGYEGGISIQEAYKLDKTFFTRSELQAILAGLSGVDSVSHEAYLTGLVEKLSSKGKQIVADDSIIIDLASHYQEPLTKKITEIKEAIYKQQMISFDYYSEKGKSIRNIEPYHLIFKWSSWYVFGFCIQKKDYRLFKLNRMGNLQVLQERFEKREISEQTLQLEQFFQSNEFHLKAIFAESEEYHLIEEYGVDCYKQYLDGRLLLERDFVSYQNMKEWVFRFGDKVEVLEPEELVIDRINQAKNIIKQSLQAT